VPCSEDPFVKTKGRCELNIVAIIPMRHNSERVPGKNYRLFGGKPLYHHIVSTLLECETVSRILIDTDSDFILDDAAHNFPSLELYRRPEYLRDGNIPMNDVLLNSVSQIAADMYLQTHSTNPLLRASTVTSAINNFLSRREDYDSMFSVTRIQTRLWRANATPLNHDPRVLLRTQDLEPIYEENSCLYMFSEETLVKNGTRIGNRPMMFAIDRIEAQDIDEEQDFVIAELLFNNQQKRCQ